MTPSIQIDQFGHYNGVSHAVEFLETLSAVAADGDYEVCAARVLPFEVRLKREVGPSGAVFETHRVAENTLDTGDMRRRISPARDCVTIGVDANRRGADEAAPAQAFVEQEPSCRIRRNADLRRDHMDASSKSPQRFHQRSRANITPAPFTDVPGNGCYKLEKLHNSRDPLAAHPAAACWFPGLFCTTDFTGPGVAMKRGRRQEPRTSAG